MSTDDNQPLNGSSAPFARRPVTWGRPPATVFRAGPLPKGERLPPLPEPPKSGSPRPGPAASSRAAILRGSMIPQAAPASRPAPTPVPEPTTFADAPARPAVARSSTGEPDLVVRPLPPVEPGPEVRLDPAPALRPAATPAAMPVVEAAAPVSPVRAPAPARRRSSGRAPLYAGVAAVVIAGIAVGGWMLTRPPATSPAAPPASASAAALLAEAPAPSPTVVEAVPAAETVPASDSATSSALPPPVLASTPTRPAPSTLERPAAIEPVATRTAPSASTVSEPAPPPASAAPTEPRIEVVPAAPAGPPPTTAERPPSDPDAPIATRPQPLDSAADQT